MKDDSAIADLANRRFALSEKQYAGFRAVNDGLKAERQQLQADCEKLTGHDLQLRDFVGVFEKRALYVCSICGYEK